MNRKKAFAIDEACRRIPPLWPLQNFVAVNPFLGLSQMSFAQAAELMERVAHGTILMDSAYYREQVRKGSLSAAQIRTALSQAGNQAEAADPIAWLETELQKRVPAERVLSVADWLDRRSGTSWSAFITDEVSKWCSSYYDGGQSSWVMPWKGLPLYEAWKRAASIDANPEVFGLADFRKVVQALPETDEEAIAHALQVLQVPAGQVNDFLHRELMSVAGWSAYAAYQDRMGAGENTVRQLLAIRLAYDVALLPQAGEWQCAVTETTEGSREGKYVAHLALEGGYRSQLLSMLRDGKNQAAAPVRPQLQAVFCIDVRSEVFRRALEAQSSGIETLGFAGFFGMPIAVASTARCPVLLSPGYQVDAERNETRPGNLAKAGAAVWKYVATSASACFSAVEIGGVSFGWRILQRVFPSSKPQAAAERLHWSISLAERVQLAAGALKNMSIDTKRLAPVVLLCGHGSTTENNPYGSSLDCGACGGHKGDVNARFAAALLNDAEVREGLQPLGMQIPADCVFVGALHNTTTDEVRIFEADTLLSPAQRAQVEGWLEAAARTARRERNGNPSGAEMDDRQLEKEVKRRSTDWSEVRPEWGLAGNAAFIAAPRSRTKQLNLEGRVFLHEYDAQADGDGSVLNLILNAPVVVASWINLQYFASTVNNRVFGSGNKVLHNVVGTFGVWEGNGGDLRSGLPLQSLHNGEQWVHQPLRLQVVIETARENIDRILEASPAVRDLVEKQWIHLIAIEGESFYQCEDAGKWKAAQ